VEGIELLGGISSGVLQDDFLLLLLEHSRVRELRVNIQVVFLQ
jgi:hypothetical protein